ncbi:glycosyltransferase family 90 protein [Trichoderma asperellum CBS 433.97]|uniref:Glycosyltransferase family 90 protein n=1 Tax=Trichoderma asperellum (strain ATCC 204424 / CBS 433.97 / NBRC 101777) TaxID=1042311 RepID=A0A2T3Z2Z0_TRIA4|nr:glycosyltransferase family 90 protein [Trichoderma asperellum CBS 433.97]PTB39162.1 glycosyltransferase family 90 protein [Trichoderma asperellum CBS 433.97]
MWRAQIDCFDHPDCLMGYIAGSVLAASAAEYWTSSRSVQAESDALSWVILLLLFKCIRRPRARAKSPDFPFQHEVKSRTGSCWIVGVAIAVASVCSAEKNTPGFLKPALIPLLLLIEGQLDLQCRRLKTGQSGGWASLAITTWGSVAISLFGVCSLACWQLPSLSASVLSSIELMALVIIYGTLLPKSAAVCSVTPFVDIEADISSLTPRITSSLLIALVIQRVLLGFVPFDLGATLLGGVVKAVTWLLAVETILAIFATRNPFVESFESQALANIVGSGLMLGQLVALTMKVSNLRFLWLFLAIPVVSYLANILAIRTAHLRAVTFANSHEHPVETIIRRANTDFNNLLLRQSQSYTDACDEYRRRYNYEPPPGFEEWFNYAKSHNSKIIDDFDVIYESIMPLWNYTGKQINQAIKDVQLYSGNELWKCRFSGQTSSTKCVHNWRSNDRHVSKLFNQLMGDVSGLPDVDFLVNHLDEPRVIFPRNHEQSNHVSGIKLKSLSRTPTWSSLTQHCDPVGVQSATNTTPPINSFGLPFIQDGRSSKDICKHPSYRQMHGLLMSPTSFQLLEGIVPILSTGSLSTMGDILFPSPAYIESEFIYNETLDIDWSQKRNNWKNYHRHRFVSLAQMLDKKEYTYLADKGGVVQRVASSFLNGRLFDVAFTRVYQCATVAYREQSFLYRIKAWADKDAAFHSRLAFDLDGNGISGRWYKMVASNSAPLKQTILREWHDDRLLPWVHFIPVSLGMEELPELVMYLTSTKKGQQTAKEIADRGRKWFSESLRDVDMGVYVYRLLLELARLQDPERIVSSKSST